jgi:hypothetical protein
MSLFSSDFHKKFIVVDTPTGLHRSGRCTNIIAL